mgnify:CR=1 FL=1
MIARSNTRERMTTSRKKASLRATIAAQEEQITKLEAERERLRKLYQNALLELEKMRRGLVGPKSEKYRAQEEQLSLLGMLMEALPPVGELATPATPEPTPPPKRHTPHGRRKPDDLSHLPVVVIRLEIGRAHV